MIEAARHFSLSPEPWDPSKVATAIDEIVSDALARSIPIRSGRPTLRTTILRTATAACTSVRPVSFGLLII